MLRVRYLFLAFLFFSSALAACIVGPEQLEANQFCGFKIGVEPSELCEQCNQLFIQAPAEYKGVPFSIGTYTLYREGVLVSKSLHEWVSESDNPEFMAVIKANGKFSYEITFNYGRSHCYRYEFKYRSSEGW